jgi:hypothetical protein
MAMSRPKIVVSDSSVVMDLAKVRLIEPVLQLPFEFMLPDVILAQELLDLGAYTAKGLLDLGFVQGDLNGDDSRQARDYFAKNRRLSLNDCFAWRLAEVHKAILMTGDANLRTIAIAAKVEVHGILWAVEMMLKHKTSPAAALAKALEHLSSDPLVQLPPAETQVLRDRLRTA